MWMWKWKWNEPAGGLSDGQTNGIIYSIRLSVTGACV